jgi:glycosyltransferase involved in cell wall biosynthesis
VNGMKMKPTVLIMTGYHPGSYSPAGERVRHLASASSSVFRKVIVLTSCATDRQPKEGLSPTVFLYSINSTKRMPFPVSAVFDPIRFLIFFVHGYLLSRHHNASYILASMPPFEIGVSGYFLAKLLNMKLIVDLRDDWEEAMSSQLTRYVPLRLISPLLELATKIYSFSIGILAITQTLVNTIRQRGIKTYIVLAPNGADTSVFFPRSDEARRRIRSRYLLPNDRIVMLYCGSGINPYYRLGLIMSCLRSLPSSVKKRLLVLFYVYNGVDYLNGLKDKLGISDNLIQVRGPLPRSELAELMAACDIGLVPFDDKSYLMYATSTKVFEYLGAGLYVIGTGPKGGELDSFFASNPVLGLLVPPIVENLARVFSKVVDNADELINDGCRNLHHSFIKENFDRKTVMLKAIQTLYNDVLVG